MSAEDQPAKPIEIVSDEDWKERVKAEDAARDAEFRGKPSPAEPAESVETAPTATPETREEPELESQEAPEPAPGKRPQIDVSQLPPVNLTLLVTMFSTQAMTALGVLPNPLTGQYEPEPALAKHYIDLLGLLEKKTTGNLDAGEAQLLGTTLHELRMLYVQHSKAMA